MSTPHDIKESSDQMMDNDEVIRSRFRSSHRRIRMGSSQNDMKMTSINSSTIITTRARTRVTAGSGIRRTKIRTIRQDQRCGSRYRKRRRLSIFLILTVILYGIVLPVQAADGDQENVDIDDNFDSQDNKDQDVYYDNEKDEDQNDNKDEEDGNEGEAEVEDENDFDMDDYLSNEIQYTPGPTPYPTLEPTLYPTSEPTRAGDDFYEIETDDGYTADVQSARIYYSSISDVILCLMCTFFWVLWLVGTIFPTKIQYLYKSEGVVVRGFVVESYVSATNGSSDEDRLIDDMALGNMGPQDFNGPQPGAQNSSSFGSANKNDRNTDQLKTKSSGGSKDGSKGKRPGLDVDLDTEPGVSILEMSDEMNIPTYHAVVSYVVPGRVACGRRRRMQNIRPTPLVPLSPVEENYVLHSEKDDENMIRADHIRNQGKPPRSPRKCGQLKTLHGIGGGAGAAPPSPSGSECAVIEDKPRNFNIASDGRTTATNPTQVATNRRQSLLDAYDTTKSFDSINTFTFNTSSNPNSKWDGNDKGYYKYNPWDDSDYDFEVSKDEEDGAFEDDPEYIGNLFYQFGLIPKPKRKVQHSEPVRVKKRFETNGPLEPGRNDVEIIVLPGNPGSGILKSDFEQDEDYMGNGTRNRVGGCHGAEIRDPTDDFGSTNQMSDFSTGMIGVVLAAVSVIGAVHGALTLPYHKRAYGWVLVIFSLSIMWPLAMYTYKTVNRLRHYMTNKIINLEPCGDASNLYGLNKLPRGKITSCSDTMGSYSDAGNEFIIMLGGKKNGRGSKGIWNYDEGSAISSLSGGDGHRRII